MLLSERLLWEAAVLKWLGAAFPEYSELITRVCSVRGIDLCPGCRQSPRPESFCSRQASLQQRTSGNHSPSSLSHRLPPCHNGGGMWVLMTARNKYLTYFCFQWYRERVCNSQESYWNNLKRIVCGCQEFQILDLSCHLKVVTLLLEEDEIMWV